MDGWKPPKVQYEMHFYHKGTKKEKEYKYRLAAEAQRNPFQRILCAPVFLRQI